MTNPPAPQLPQSEEFWISDGNVILQTKTKLYCVHNSMLCRHSTVFKVILAGNANGITRPSNQPIHVQGLDRDWDVLLSILYGTRSLHDEGTGLIPFDILQALLRLGHPYAFSQYKQALKQLKEALPDTLEGWDKLLGSRDLKMRQLRKFGRNHAFGLLCISWELNLKKCLPTAYFNCLRYRKPAQISYGRDCFVVETRRAESYPVLSTAMQVRLLVGKEKIRNKLFTHSLSWWHTGSKSVSCKAKIKCARVIRAFLAKQRLDDHKFNNALDLFQGGGGLCASCTLEAMVVYNTGRAKLFNELPSIFCGVPGWDNLEDAF